MLVGTLPFTSKGANKLLDEIRDRIEEMPKFLTPEAQALLRALLEPIPQNRLGAGPTGVQGIKGHDFFASIDWIKLERKELNSPFQPIVHSDEAYYFDSEFTSRTPKGFFFREDY